MVRVKHRYLLVNILYPEPSASPSSSSTAVSKTHAQQSQLRIHAPTSDALTPSLLARMIRDEVAEIFGDWGIGRLGGVGAGGVSVKYLSSATSTAIIRCPRASYRLVWTALTYMDRVPEINEGGKSGRRGGQAPLTRPCVFRVLRVSGTIRKAEEEAVRRARREIVRLRAMDEVGVLGVLVGGLERGGGGDLAIVDNKDDNVEMDSGGD
ncbi:Rpp14/Pop5 family protein [Aspergillus lucknowensis]|uniref:Rpp14/Pop5 family-domain-containing protein n=1 Tax=Aspergillus lucknowensis TaxID=176173 RepID=A0ABR4M1I3_9EURO